MMLSGSLLSATLATCSAAWLPAGDHDREFLLDGLVRSYTIHIPASYDAKKPTPVVLVLHSAMMNGAMMAQFCGMTEKSDQAGFVVVYANGTGTTPLFRYWDAGGVRGRVANDVGYVKKLLVDLAEVVHVDSRRVFATGMSNGAMMCYRLAAELSDQIAAIATVGGTMAIENCHPSRPVPVLHFHGTKDGLVLYGGPDERTPKNLKFLSVDETIQTWIKVNGCPREPRVDHLPDLVDDGTKVARYSYGPGKDGAEVTLYAIEGGGHTWPGRSPATRFLGRSTLDVSANDLIWEFFQKHPMK